MDGFNVISVEKDSSKNSAQNIPTDFGVEIIDEEKEKKDKASADKSSSLFLSLAIIFLIGVIGYLVFLIFYRISSVGQILDYADEMNNITKNIDTKEIQEFQMMDKTLKSVKGKLDKHILTSDVMTFTNSHLRKTLQISEYRLDIKQKDVEVGLTAVAPSFKELTEQTEKLFSLKEIGAINSFNVSSLSFESETKRVKFTLKILFDKSKINATTINQNTN